MIRRVINNALLCLAIAAMALGLIAVIALGCYIGYHRIRFYLTWGDQLPL